MARATTVWKQRSFFSLLLFTPYSVPLKLWGAFIIRDAPPNRGNREGIAAGWSQSARLKILFQFSRAEQNVDHLGQTEGAQLWTVQGCEWRAGRYNTFSSTRVLIAAYKALCVACMWLEQVQGHVTKSSRINERAERKLVGERSRV